MSKIGGKHFVSKRKQRNPHYLQSQPPRIPSGMLLRNNTTLSKVMMTYIPNGPHCGKKETKQCHISQISSKWTTLYTPLPTPDRPWEFISMDYMSGLPSTKQGNDCVFVVVDCFSKMAIMVSCKKSITAKATAKIFFERVWVHFVLPKTIISNRDSRFLSTFWSSLWSLLDTKLTKSMAFHPQIDGQTEVVNRMVVHILRMYNSNHPHRWDESLPYVHHIYNGDMHRSTSHNPFQVGLGFQPLGPIDVALPLVVSSTNSSPVPTEVDKST
jgi:hypothetical protein